MNEQFTSIDHFFRGAFSIDLVLLSFDKGELKVLLERKTQKPYADSFGLPGDLILPNENTDIAIENLSKRLIGTNHFYKKQLRAFSDVGRHPLGRVITFAYYGLIPFQKVELNSSANLKWICIQKIPQLPYDHNDILTHVLNRFRKGLLRHPNVFELLPKEFTISDIIQIYELAFNRKLDPSNFGKQVKSSKLIEPLNKYREQENKTGRPPLLFRFNQNKYKSNKQEKIQFNF